MNAADPEQALYRELVLQFLAELMTATAEAPTPAAFHAAVQAYCEELRPWLAPADAPAEARSVFPLFAECTLDEERDLVTVRLSPEGEAFFRAWVRRRAILLGVGMVMDPGGSH